MVSEVRPKLQISHTKFSVLFCALLYVACNATNIDKLAKWFFQKEGIDYFALTAYLIAGLCVLIVFFTLLAHRWTIKPAVEMGLDALGVSA